MTLSALVRLLILAPLGFILACVSAAVMISVGIFGIENLDPDTIGWYVGGIVAATFWAGTLAFLPALIAIIFAEVFRLRSILYYLFVGGLIGAIGSQMTAQTGALDFADRPIIVLIAAGFVGGFAYWLVAGRLAGIGFRDDSPPGSA